MCSSDRQLRSEAAATLLPFAKTTPDLNLTAKLVDKAAE
jgi:hypothetical protein